ncbi:MAG: chemotaxis-specific protein-glutamate methyltransferase CheB [Bacillota bacterium]|nr:chemotaxis-specific protein-glutamate methyltransferase CheB [Bacillota bacterium]
MKIIKVLVVSNYVYIDVIIKGLSLDPGIKIIPSAYDAVEARNRIVEYEPDVLVLDEDLPDLSGVEFLKKLMPQHPLPVVMLVSGNKNTSEAVKSGAADIIKKPDQKNDVIFESLINELKIKIKISLTADLSKWNKETEIRSKHFWKHKIIAIGSSTGGTEALIKVLQLLPGDVPGIVIVQHMPPGFTKMYAERLNKTLHFNVKEAQTGDIVKQGCVFIAPGDQHIKIEKAGEAYKIICFKSDKVNGHCPSVDVLFNSVAEKAGKEAIGVILTGMGGDGARGLLAMRSNGARTAGQDEGSSIVYGMPKVAYDIGAVEEQAPLDRISEVIYKLLNER